jgi:group I intron endonuclease
MVRKINPGIYMIVHVNSGKKYIGSSVTPADRLSVHRRALRKGKHSNCHLQNAWNVHGEKSFEFSIIEENIQKDLLAVKETEYIISFGIADQYTGKFFEDKGYNMCWPKREGFKNPSLRKKGKDHHLYGKSSWSKGVTLTNEHKSNISKNSTRIKTYILIDVNNNVTTVTNLTKFCRENNYKPHELRPGKLKKNHYYISITLKGEI